MRIPGSRSYHDPTLQMRKLRYRITYKVAQEGSREEWVLPRAFACRLGSGDR